MSRARREVGAATVEYVGIMIAVAALVVALVAGSKALGLDLGAKLRCAVESVSSQASGACGGSADPVTYEAGDVQQGAAGRYQNATVDDTPVNPRTVETAVADVRDALGGGFFGVRRGELADIREALERLSPGELDAVFAELSDAELARWVDQMEDGWLFGGWSAAERRVVWELLASRASKETLDRLARFTHELQPKFDKVGGDSARDNPESVANTGQYGELPHQLFVDGVDPRDVGQGALGDCWWLASIMAVAQADPSVIENAITANPNGSYTVRLYDDGKPVYVTVTPEMVLKPDGTPAFVGNDTSSTTYELWPMVLEKALALHYGNFDDIEGGWPSVGMTTLTGQPSTDTAPGKLSITELRDVLDRDGAVGLASLTKPDAKNHPLYTSTVPADRLYANHAYYVSAVDVAAGTVTVTNPWGIASWPPITLTYDEFVSGFRLVTTNEVNP